LDPLAALEPDLIFGLIEFHSTIRLFGDCSKPMIDIEGFNEWAEFDEFFVKKNCYERLSLPISQQKEKIR
jgi:hypothetical protein